MGVGNLHKKLNNFSSGINLKFNKLTMKNYSFIFSISILFISCPFFLNENNQELNSHNRVSLNLNRPLDSLIDLETIEDYIIVGDTLKIVSTSDFLYYPFGRYRDKNLLNERFKSLEKSIDRQVDLKIKSSEAPILVKFSMNDSYIKFFYDKENKQFEIVSAKIFSSKILMNNQLGVNIPKTNFMSKFSYDTALPETSNVSVIELISGLDGVWHYYTFENDTLKSIRDCSLKCVHYL